MTLAIKYLLILFIISISFNAKPLKTDKFIIHKKLSNGFEYYIVKNTNPKKSVDMTLYVKTGSKDENQNQLLL